jgi:4-hydroxybenzoate polyprenyltransferase
MQYNCAGKDLVAWIDRVSMNKKLSFTHSKTLRGWLEIIRPPNLFTIPGDILAGASLAFLVEDRIHKVFPVIIISLLLYISGLILNDYFDCKVDRIERPLRPIPSGGIRPRVPLLVSMVLIGTAIGIGFLISGRGILPGKIPFFTTQGTLTLKVVLILVVLILLYNKPYRG